MPISKHTQFQPLQVLEDKSVDIITGSIDRTLKKVEANQELLQTHADKLQSLDIYRASDKEYFDQKYQETMSAVEKLGSADLTDPKYIRQAQRAMNGLVKDQRIKNSIESTKNVRNVIDGWQKIQSDPKLAKQFYNSNNYLVDMHDLENYTNDTDDMAKFNKTNPSIYDGFHEDLDKSLKSLDVLTKEIPDGNFGIDVIKGRSKEALNATVSDKIKASNQFNIDFKAEMIRNPNYAQYARRQIETNIEEAKAMRSEYATKLQLMPQGDPGRETIETLISNLDSNISTQEGLRGATDEEISYNVFAQDFRKRKVHEWGDVSRTKRIDPVSVKLSDYAYRDKQLQLQQTIAQDKSKLGWAKFGEDRRQFDANLNYKLKVADAKKEALSEGETDSGDFDEILLTTTDTVVPDKTQFQLHNEQLRDLRETQLNELNGILEDVHGMLGAEDKQFVDEQLRAAGINPNDLGTSKDFFKTPKNVEIVSAAIDMVYSRSGGIAKGYAAEIHSKLKRLKNTNQAYILQRSHNQALQSQALMELNREGHNITPEDLRNDPDGSKMKLYRKKVNDLMEIEGPATIYATKAVPASILNNESIMNRKDNQAIGNLMGSIKNNANYLKSVDGESYYYLKDTSISGGSVHGRRHKDLMGKMDWSKSTFGNIRIDQNAIEVFPHDAEGNPLLDGKKVLLPLSTDQARAITNRMAGDGVYDQILDKTRSLDFYMDNESYSNLTKQKFKNHTFLFDGESVNMPKNFVLNYAVTDFGPGKRVIKFQHKDYPGQYKLRFATMKQFEQNMGKSYQTALAVAQKQNPGISGPALEELAVKLLMDSLVKQAHKQ